MCGGPTELNVGDEGTMGLTPAFDEICRSCGKPLDGPCVEMNDGKWYHERCLEDD